MNEVKMRVMGLAMGLVTCAWAGSATISISVKDKAGQISPNKELWLVGDKSEVALTTDATGKAQVVLPDGDSYKLYFQNFMGEKELCKQCNAIDLPNNLPEGVQGAYDYWFQTDVIRLNILFDLAKASLRKDATTQGQLDKLAKIMLGSPEMKVEIAGHTDDVGSDVANEKLSLARAQSVVAALIARGVPSARLVAQGYGERAPLIAGTSASAREANRRTEAALIP